MIVSRESVQLLRLSNLVTRLFTRLAGLRRLRGDPDSPELLCSTCTGSECSLTCSNVGWVKGSERSNGPESLGARRQWFVRTRTESARTQVSTGAVTDRAHRAPQVGLYLRQLCKFLVRPLGERSGHFVPRSASRPRAHSRTSRARKGLMMSAPTYSIAQCKVCTHTASDTDIEAPAHLAPTSNAHPALTLAPTSNSSTSA